MSKAALFVPCLAIFALSTTLARATPNFPDALKSDLGLPAAPDCTLCHNNENGGTGTVKTAFGKNMLARGLLAFSTDTLRTALTLMDQNHVISAGGCLPDIEELKAGRDPNHPNDASTCDGGTVMPPGGTTDGGRDTSPDTAGADTGATPTPEYGCRGAAIARADAGLDGVALFASALSAAALVRRRRR